MTNKGKRSKFDTIKFPFGKLRLLSGKSIYINRGLLVSTLSIQRKQDRKYAFVLVIKFETHNNKILQHDVTFCHENKRMNHLNLTWSHWS